VTPDKQRKTSQDLLPIQHKKITDSYDLYPAFPLPAGQIQISYANLAVYMATRKIIILDGYAGVFWDQFRTELDKALLGLDIQATWMSIDSALRPQSEIEKLISPFLNGDDPLFGTRFTKKLRDFFDPKLLNGFQPDPQAQITILYGCGAALVDWDAFVVYIDLPKNEIQFRARAGMITTLATNKALDAKLAYKRCYFVDWVVLRQHQAEQLERIDLVVDGQSPDAPRSMSGNDFRAALHKIAHNFVRPRPWFEAGVWGGQWLKQYIPALPQSEVNYAWSFELISPENGFVFESDGFLLEASFDWLMAAHATEILGIEHAKRFGTSFPIRFDYLDTIEGGNLSLQCHPRPDYIHQHFGEDYTQDETYYIFESVPNARVYLGFQENFDLPLFERTLEESFEHNIKVDVEKFIISHAVNKHDLFLIPNGTVHASGTGNVILEISATPYIFTLKMYDWLRLGLDGNPRPLNLQRAFDNLHYDYKGERVLEELICHHTLLQQGDDWQIIHYPTHREHFYDVHRLDFEHEITVELHGSCHVLCMVEGGQIELITANGKTSTFHYAETFMIPAAAERYSLRNLGSDPVKVIKAFLKSNWSL
jgi:mannose-6-phosphate isomerase class I